MRWNCPLFLMLLVTHLYANGPSETEEQKEPEESPSVGYQTLPIQQTLTNRSTPTTTSDTPDPLPLAELAVILQNGHFIPSKIRLREGLETKLILTNLERKPAALLVEAIALDQWLVRNKTSTVERHKNVVQKELLTGQLVEVSYAFKKGEYVFQDPISGAYGQIRVE